MNQIQFENRANITEPSVTESFKAVRTALIFSRADTKVITFTSTDPGDGKSFVSFQVAKNLAETNNRILYIDADMRASSFAANYTKSVNPKGLSHYLSDQRSLEEVLCPTEIENLYLIFSGEFPPNPAELLSSIVFRKLLAEARKSFDFIIIDAPPVGVVTDASICIAESDGSIFVLNHGKTKIHAAKEAKKIMLETGKPIIGCVLNKIPLKHHKYGKYGSYGAYGTYGSYGKYTGGSGNRSKSKR